MRRPLLRALIVTGSVLASLLLVELGFRAYFGLVTNYDMEMFRYARLLKVKTRDGRSHAHLPGKTARLMKVEVTTNSHGLRDVERPYAKEPGRFRILVLGDSFTMGWGVPFEGIYPRILEARLNERSAPSHPAIEVINLGVGNYNTEQELAALRAEGLRYDPDLVVLAFYINDLEPAQESSESLSAGGSYTMAFLQQRLIQARGWLDPGFRYESYYRAFYTGPRWERFRRVVAELSAEIRERHLRLLPVLLPDLRRLEDYPFGEEHRKVMALFREQGWEPADLLPAFEGQPSRSFWVASDDPHPNAEAHRRIARALERALRERRLLP